nr:MAG: nucleoprotein [Byreldi virus]
MNDNETDMEAPIASGSTVQPAVANPPRPMKRIHVDRNGEELPDPKRNRATPNVNVKLNAIKFILHFHEYLMKMYKVTERNNIDDIADLTSIMATLHNKFRQEANGQGSLRNKIRGDFNMTCNNINVTAATLIEIYRKIANKYGFTYENTQAGKAKTGTLQSVLMLMVMYRPRSNEVRVGSNRITLRKDETSIKERPITQFGMDSMHEILCTGCTYTPVIQSSMKQSLGPMTVVMNLATTSDVRFQGGWKEVFSQMFKTLPNSQEIAMFLAGTDNEHGTIIRHLADIALFSVTRDSHKAALAVAFLLHFCFSTHQQYTSLFTNIVDYTVIEIMDENLPINIRNLDFSGHGLLAFWNRICALEFRVRGGETMLENDASEWVFHSVFGTQTEDLGYLEWLTEHRFQTRREFDQKFKGKGTTRKSVRVNLISFKKFAKLASAAQTNYITGGTGQVSRKPVFSGYVEQSVNLEGVLMSTLQTDRRVAAGLGTLTKEKIINLLSEVKKNMFGQISKEAKIRFGTVEHKRPVINGDGSCYGPTVTEIPTLTQRYFYGNEI